MTAARALTVLGFDFGTRHIGVAVGQTVTGTASALETVGLRKGKLDWERIEALIKAWQPDRLVVGEPLNMDGTEQAMTQAARRFARQLHGRFELPVEVVDERLSTVAARELMVEGGAKPGARHGARRPVADHPVAAKVILQTWLSENES